MQPNGLDTTRNQLRLITVAWFFGSFWLWTISGAAMTQFQRAIGTPDWAFGLLAAIPFLGALAQLPASWWINARGGRRRLFLIFGVAGRLMYVLMGLVPWLLPNQPNAWWPLVSLAMLVGWLAMQATGPAWMNWMADLIPPRVRGRYFSMRQTLSTPVAVATILISALLLDWTTANHPDQLKTVTSWMLIFAGLMGALDILTFLWVQDPYEVEHQSKRQGGESPELHDPSFRGLFRPLRNAGFRRYVAFNAVFGFALAFLGQYVWLYALDVLMWSNLKANVLVAAVPLTSHMLTRPLWGRLIDRLGKRPVLLISGVMVGMGALGWLMITPDRLFPGYLLVILVAMAWPGMEVANFNFLLDYSHRKRAGPQATAVNSLASAVAGTLSGLMAGGIAAWLGPSWLLATGVLGIGLTYHGVLMLISTVLRFVALGFAVGLDEPQAKGTRESIAYMATGVYNNIRQNSQTPTRVAGSALRWAYRVDRRGRRRR